MSYIITLDLYLNVKSLHLIYTLVSNYYIRYLSGRDFSSVLHTALWSGWLCFSSEPSIGNTKITVL